MDFRVNVLQLEHFSIGVNALGAQRLDVAHVHADVGNVVLRVFVTKKVLGLSNHLIN